MKFSQIICLAALLVASAGAAQKPAELKKSGEKFFANARWYDAMLALSQYQQAKPGDLDVLTKLGICNIHLHNAAKGREYLEYVLRTKPTTTDPDLFYHLARVLHLQGEWQKAMAFYKQFLKNAPPRHALRANAVDNIKRCVSGINTRPNEQVALVESLGERVNTMGDEFAPLPSVNRAGRLYFAAAREGCTGGLRTDEGLADGGAGHWASDIFFSNLATSGWDYAEPLGSLLNTARAEVPLGFNETGQVLFYWRGFTLFSGQLLADTASKKDEYAVQPPTFDCPFRAETGDQAPFFFNDSTLLFASRRPGGRGGLDLWLTRRRTNGGWSEPENLGETLNSPYDETTPFLAADGRTLFFSANHLGSIGGLDVFKTVFDDRTRAWSAPQNLGAGINSPGDDAFFRLEKTGKSAFFASDRLESLGERDLFTVYFKEAQAEMERRSVPALFADVGQNMGEPVAENERETLSVPLLFYTNDRDVASEENLKTLGEIVARARQFPEINILVTAHTDESGPAKFDLYFGIKRAEIIGKALTDKGLAASRIVLRSVGSFYPIAQNVLGMDDNPTGRKLNRRIELDFAVPSDAKPPVDLQLRRPTIPEIMASDAGLRLEDLTAGLSYKVEVASTRQILANDALAMFSDLMIESDPGTGQYRYTVGFLKNYKDAAALRKELAEQGFEEAFVVAYINGVRRSKAEAVGLTKKFPDLAAFVHG